MSRRLIDRPRPTVVRVVELATLASLAFLFLQATATIDASYTVRVSFVLVLVACALGLPLIIEGWRGLPFSLGATALLLFGAYLLAWIFGDLATVSTGRGGGTRAASYVGDLAVGLLAIGLVAALWTRPSEYIKPLSALVFGATVASLYGIYQWFALHHGWPLSDVVDVVDSNGVTVDGSQGVGILGWERIRGTFLEPHLLATYVAVILPVCAVLTARSRGRARVGMLAATSSLLLCLLLTSSLSTWAIVAVATGATGTLYCIAMGFVTRAAVCGASLAVIAICSAVVVAAPELSAKVTGRSEKEIVATFDSRTEQWDSTLELLDVRPALGYGPGQSSVQFAANVEGVDGVDQVVLGTANGLWAASLIDVGLVGAAFWVLFLGAAVAYVVREVLRAPDTLSCALLLACVVAILDTLVVGDRPPTQLWLLIGLGAGYVRAQASSRPVEGDYGLGT